MPFKNVSDGPGRINDREAGSSALGFSLLILKRHKRPPNGFVDWAASMRKFSHFSPGQPLAGYEPSRFHTRAASGNPTSETFKPMN